MHYDGAVAVDRKPLKLSVANDTSCEHLITNYMEMQGRVFGIKDTNRQRSGETDTPYNVSISRTLSTFFI